MPKTEPEPLTKEEVDKIIELSAKSPFYYILFNLAKYTGRRLGEFYGVEKKEVIGEKVVGKKKVYTDSGNQIEVDKKVHIYKATGKFEYGMKVKDFIETDSGEFYIRTWVLKRRNYIQDETHIPQHVGKLLKRYIRENKLGLEDYLFRKVSYRAIQNAVNSFAKQAGIKKNASFHSFRHYFVTSLLKKGWSHDKIAKITGHKSVQSISSYDHVLSSDLKDKLNEDLTDI